MITQGTEPATKRPIRVLTADDQTIVRGGIAALLDEAETIEVVGQACNGQEAIAQVQALDPDVTLMDLMMPVMDGIEAIRRIGALQARTRVLVLTSFADDEKVFPALRAGALGYLLEESDLADLIRAIEHVNRGEPWLHPSIAMQVIQQVRRPAQDTPPPNILTTREVDVVCLLAKGLRNREIAEQLGTTEDTIKSHVSSILAKLHLNNRVQAALYALTEGLTSLAEATEPDRTETATSGALPSPMVRSATSSTAGCDRGSPGDPSLV